MKQSGEETSISLTNSQDYQKVGFKVSDSGQQRALIGELDFINVCFNNDYLLQSQKDEMQTSAIYQSNIKQSLNSTMNQFTYPYPITTKMGNQSENSLFKERFTSSNQQSRAIHDESRYSQDLNKNVNDLNKIMQDQLFKQNSKQYSMNLNQDDKEGFDKSFQFNIQNKSLIDGQPEENKIEEEFDRFGNKYVTPLIWRKNFFKLLLITNRFRFYLKKVLIFLKPMYLSEYQLSAINDRSAQTFQEAQIHESQSSELYKPKKRTKLEKKIRILYLTVKKQMRWIIVPIKNCFLILTEYIQLLDKQIPLTNPFNVVMLLWDFVIILFCVLHLILIPYQICFLPAGYNQNNNDFSKQISYIIFLFDIFISMNTSNYVKGELEKQRIKVIKNYIKNQLAYDAICLICLILDQPFNQPLFRLGFLLKMIKVGDLIEKNREFFQIDDKYSSITNLILLMAKIMYLCHLFACFWYKIGRFVQSNGDTSWLDSFQGQEENDNLYINAIYFAAITITTVGYGDITPKSKIEKVFVIFMSFISCANFGYALNQIGSIIQEINTKKEKYRQNIATINKYMKEREVNKLLQSKTRKYFEYIYSQSENLNNSSDNILSKLSSNLQLQIKKEVNLKTLKKIPFLFETFSVECLEKIAIKINEKYFGVGECIIDQYEQSKPALYFIIKGEVSIFLKDKQSLYNKIFQLLQQDEVFGEYQFFSQNYKSAQTVISTGQIIIPFISLLIFIFNFQS